jgi:hypothetical protein
MGITIAKTSGTPRCRLLGLFAHPRALEPGGLAGGFPSQRRKRLQYQWLGG